MDTTALTLALVCLHGPPEAVERPHSSGFCVLTVLTFLAFSKELLSH